MLYKIFQDAKVCVAVVLYMPDISILQRQIENLVGIPLIAYANGSLHDDIRAALGKADLLLIESPTNVGLGLGLNAVMTAAIDRGFTHVFLLDQDSEPNLTMLSALTTRLLELGQRGEKVALVAPRLVPPEGENYKPIHYNWRRVPAAPGLAAVDFAPTSGSLLSVAAYREIGAFRGDFFIGGIDVEWGFRAWSKGFASFVLTEWDMPHRWGERAKDGSHLIPQILRQSPLRNYYYIRNVIAVARLPYVPLSWRLRSLAIMAVQVVMLVLRGPSGALRAVRWALRDGFQNRLGPAPHELTFVKASPQS